MAGAEHLDPRFKQLMKQLGEAINHSLAESEPMAEVIARIKNEGYDVFLVLEATIGFNQREPEPVPAANGVHKAEPEFKINAQDLRFLKSLRIAVDDAA